MASRHIEEAPVVWNWLEISIYVRNTMTHHLIPQLVHHLIPQLRAIFACWDTLATNLHLQNMTNSSCSLIDHLLLKQYFRAGCHVVLIGESEEGVDEVVVGCGMSGP